jgi:hypothetical protein
MASAYLTRTPSSASNKDLWTLSFWIKRSTLGTTQSIYGVYADSNNQETLAFDSNDKLYWQLYQSGGVVGQLTTNRLFRDTSAWYHIVVAYDSANSTAGNRMRMYINGVEETSFATDTNPSSGQDSQWNSTTAHSIGRINTTNYFDGLITHFNNIDGTALTPTSFGQSDSNGVWIPKPSPSVTYGTNGFFLKMDNSGNMGLDSGGGSNNFTTSGTITQAKDTPSNVFATLNPLDVFNTSGRTLSNGNNTYTTSSGNNSEVAGTLAASSGKYYFETKIVSQSGSAGSSAKYGVIGVKKINKGTLAAGEAATIYSDGRKNNGYDSVSNATPGYTLNDIVQVALDLDNNQIFFGLNGNWGDNAGNFNQTFANATALYTSLSTVGEWTPYLNKNVTNDNTLTLSANFGNGYFGTTAVTSAGANASGNGIFEYDVPTGYTALSTKGLNS